MAHLKPLARAYPSARCDVGWKYSLTIGYRRRLFCGRRAAGGRQGESERRERGGEGRTRGVMTMQLWLGISTQSARSNVRGSLLCAAHDGSISSCALGGQKNRKRESARRTQ